MLTTAAVGVGAVLVALATTGGTYALWNTDTSITTASIHSGSTGLTIDGASGATLKTPAGTTLDNTVLGPGDKVAAAFTLANTGTTALDVTVSQTVISTDPNGIAQYLTVVGLTKVASAAACSTSATSGAAQPLSGFSTSSAVMRLDATGTSTSSAVGCLVLAVSTTIPAQTTSRSAGFTMTFTGTQVAS